MSRDSIVLFLSVLALFAQIGIVAAVVIGVASRFFAWGRVAGTAVVYQFGPAAVLLAWVVAVIATAGSLYFSEGAHFIPCKLCWYQRTAMYPMSVILGVAALRRRIDVAWYAIPLAVGGVMISIYHILLERFPSLESSVCDATNPCTIIWTKRFGFETIPTMALTGFVLIITLLVVGLRYDHVTGKEE